MGENIFKIAKLQTLSHINFEVSKFNYSLNNESKEGLSFFISGNDVNNYFSMEILMHYSLRWCHELELCKKQTIESNKIEIVFGKDKIFDLDSKCIVELVRYLENKYLMSIIFLMMNICEKSK